MDFDEHDLEEGDGAFIEKALYGIAAALALITNTTNVTNTNTKENPYGLKSFP